MEHNILGTPQPRRRSRIVPGLVEELNRECNEVENQEKESQSLEQKSSKIIISDIKDICRGYEEFMGWENRDTKISTQITDKYNPTKQQVLDFSKSLINYRDLMDFQRDCSNYLTALIHSSNEKEFEIDLRELNKCNTLLDYLGYKLENKILVVNGNAGDCVGRNTKNSKITINGSAGDLVGSFVENSKITINGSAEDLVGRYAKNCEIYVRDNIGGISDDMVNSKVYQFKDKKWVMVKG